MKKPALSVSSESEDAAGKQLTEKGNAICFYDYLEGVSKGGKSVLKIYPFLTVANLTVKLQITRKTRDEV